MNIEVAGIRKFAFAMVAGLVFVAAPPGAAAQAVEGKQYSRINPVPVETGKKIEVIEFFSYGCPHCAEFEPVLMDWVKAQPADVAVRRVPVMFQPRRLRTCRPFSVDDGAKPVVLHLECPACPGGDRAGSQQHRGG